MPKREAPDDLLPGTLGWRGTAHAAIRPIAVAALVAVAYVVGARVGFTFGLVGGNASPIWPPAGIAVAALLLGGRRLWPAILVGSVVANMANGATLLGTATGAAGAITEALLAVELLQRWGLRPQLDRLRDVPVLALAGSALPAAISATIGVAGLGLGGIIGPGDVGLAWVSWWLGDALSILVVGGLLLTWGTPAAVGFLRQHPVESALALGSVAAGSIVLFFDVFSLSSFGQSVVYPIIPLVIWVAFRVGPRGNALAAITYSVVAIAATQRGVGPFVGTTREGTLLYVTAFIALVAISGSAMAAVVAERQASAAALSEAVQRAADDLRQLQAVESIARLLVEQGPTPAALQSVVDALGDVFGYTHPSIYTGNERLMRLGAQRGYTDPVREFDGSAGVMGRAMRSRQTQFVPDASADADFIREDPAIRSEIAAPLVYRGALLGILDVESAATLSVRDVSAVSVAAGSVATALALAIERDRLAEAQRIARIGEWDWDLATGALQGSGEMCRIAGFEPGGYPATDEAFMLTVHPEDRARQKEAEHAAFEGQRSYSVDIRIIRPDGTVRVTHEEAEVIRDPSGRPIGMIGTAQDITERRAAQLERARLSAVVEQSPESIVITDTEGTIEYVNPAFERVTGYTREEAVGQNPRILQSGLQPATFYEGMWTTLASGRPWTGDFVNRRKDGSLFTEAAVISSVRDTDGLLTGYVAVKHDVTHERELEGRLQQAERMEAVGQLAGGIAHDFNNLLTAIRGYCELLRSDLPADGGTSGDDLAEIVAATDRAALLTRQLLAFSRRQVVKPQVLDPAAVVAAITPMLRRLIGEHIELVARTHPGTGMVKMDPGHLEQVIVNLAVNARDAMERGGTLTIELTAIGGDGDPARLPPDLASGPHVRLSVADDGGGIDTATQARMFEPFFTTKPVGEGTGLGLATVYGIVKQSGGAITVVSAPGEGTTVTVYLPRVAEASDHPGSGERAPTPTGSGTVLLAEDEPAVRELARRLLTRLGYTVLTAATGDEALAVAAAQGGSIDLLVTDVVMPGMQGPELARRLTATHPDLRVLYMSGYTGGQLGRDDLPAWVGLLAKPFTADELGRAVRHALDAERTRDAR